MLAGLVASAQVLDARFLARGAAHIRECQAAQCDPGGMMHDRCQYKPEEPVGSWLSVRLLAHVGPVNSSTVAPVHLPL